MKPYSNDLRHRIVEACESGKYSQGEVAELFQVSLATVKNFLRRKRETGSADALPHAGGNKPLLDEKARLFIRQSVAENNDLTLDELCQRVKAKHKKAVSLPTMSRLLQTLNLPRKKSRSTPPNETRRGSSRREPSTGN
ncbi:MAG TPA: transposase [Blastocatellia bacterium]|nr:transposase [Blastocatellia bacterium]